MADGLSMHPANNHRKEIMDWLKAPDCSANFVAAVNKRTPETGKWILNHPAYTEWKENGDILWIQGKGKYRFIHLFNY